ncbi:MAG: leucine-rich repeat domain-containing protein [Muribaculaceae bacterium]|nr:leucine-rich repeat domain-containing protein [Muribaculaceae bacterium]
MNLISTRRLAVVVSAGVILPLAAHAVKPYKPEISAGFSLNSENKGVVSLTVTAPSAESVTTSMGWMTFESAGDPLPEDTRMTVTVTRTCTSLGESKIPVATIENVEPGQVLSFDDDQNEYPHQTGYSYTYYCKAAVVSDGSGDESTEVSASVKFGITPDMASSCVVTENADGSVTVELVAPSTYNSTEPIPVDLDVMEVYRLGEYDSSPSSGAEPFVVITSPQKGETVQFTDDAPAVDRLNNWYVKVKCSLGETGRKYTGWVGYDKPRPVTGVSASVGPDGVALAWTAPSSGQNDYNGSKFDPTQTRYRIYRVFDYSTDTWVMIAEDISETVYLDSGEDLSEPVKINYAVVAYNTVGTASSAHPNNTLASTQPYVVGPQYTLPFEENVSEDKKTDRLWLADDNSGTWVFRKPFVVGKSYTPTATVEGPGGAGVLGVNYTDYGYPKADVKNALTSHSIDFSDVASPVLKFSYYAIPSNDTQFEVRAVADGDTVVLRTIKISEGITFSGFSWENDNWREVTIGLEEFGGAKDFRIVFASWYESAAHTTMISGVSIVDKGEETGLFIVDGVKYAVIPLENQIMENYSDDLPADKVAAIKYVGDAPEASVPQTVNGYGVDYLVERVAERAFAGNMAVREVSVAAHTTDEAAFEGCPSLEKVSLLEGVRVIGSRAFADCVSLKRVEFFSTPVPEVAADAFTGIHEECTGSCPAEDYADYIAHESLRSIAFEPPTGVGLLFDNAATADVFTLDGVCVLRQAEASDIATLAPGVYIVRAGGRAVKTVIR